MLSFKDIQIIETSLDKVDGALADGRELEGGAVDRVYKSINDLLTSRFYNEIKNNLMKFFSKELIKSIRVKCSQKMDFSHREADFVKLKSHDLSLYMTHRNLGSLADYIWSSRAIERVDSHLYQSDLVVGQKIASMIYGSFYTAIKPLVQPHDYRVNTAYKEAIYQLQDSDINFLIEVSFEHFQLRIHGHCLASTEFIHADHESASFELALISA